MDSVFVELGPNAKKGPRKSLRFVFTRMVAMIALPQIYFIAK